MKPRVNAGSRDKAVRPDGALMSQQRFGNRSRSAGSRPPGTTGPFGYISRRAGVAADLSPEAGRVADERRVRALGEDALEHVELAAEPVGTRSAAELSAARIRQLDLEMEEHRQPELTACPVHRDQVEVVVHETQLQLAVHPDAVRVDGGAQPVDRARPAGVDGPAGNEAIGKPLDGADDVVEGQADSVR